MKRIFGIFSLAMLIFSTFTPSFTYAEVDDEYILNTFSSLLNGIGTELELNNLTENSDGSKTIISGDIEITIASSNQSTLSDGKYFWGNDTETSLSQTSDTRGEQFNDNRGGGNDILNNGYNGGLNQKRKGPCDDGRHVPSRGEWNDLAVAWCIQNENCNVETGISYNDDGTVKNLYNAEKTLGKLFKEDFLLQDGIYWTSTPYPGDNNKAFVESIGNAALVNSDSGRASRNYVRCFKDIIKSKTITYHPNGGAFSGMQINETKNYTYQYDGGNLIPIYNIQIPDRASDNINQQSGWMFAGWYTTQGDWENQTEEFDPEVSNTNIAYAKWLPFNDLELSEIGLTGIYIMDRNLGAEDIAVGTYNQTENSTKLGYYFQWGNNYGFKNTKNTYPQNSGTQQITNMEHSTNPWGPGNYYYSNKFIKISTLNANRESSNNKNLWGGESSGNPDSSKKGPCPAGYHVPDTLEWKKIHESFINETEKNENYCNGELSNISFCFAKKLKLPYAGSRNTQNGGTMDQGIIGRYWTSSPYSNIPNKNDAEVLMFDDGTINSYLNSRIRTNGYSIRCIKDSPIKNINYITDGGKEVTEIKTTNRYREEKRILPTTSKDYYTFEGWYTTSNYTIGSKVETNDIKGNNIGTINLYAKWKKNPEITLKTNGGKFETGEEEKLIKAKKKAEKKLINNTQSKNTVRKVVVFTGAESIHLSGTGSPTCNDKINIYNCDKEKNNECNIYKTINANCGQKGCFFIDEDISGDTITIEAETGSCNATPTFNYTATSNGIDYYETSEEIPNIKRNGYEFLGWYNENSELINNISETPISGDKTLYANWKALEEKAQETITESVVYTNNTTVTVGDETTEEVLSGSTTIELKTKEVESEEVKTEEDKTKVQEEEIKVTSDKTIEYEGGLEVYLEKKVNEQTEIITGTAKFSAPIAVKIPVTSDSEYVKVQVKHYGEEFGYTGLTLNPENECNNGVAVNDKYNGENIKVKGSNGEKYVLIYTCSASTFVAYSENKKPVVPTPAAGGGRTIKQESKATEQEHNSADTEKNTEQENNKSTSNQTTKNTKVNEQVKNFSNKSLTRGEVAVMTNILLEVYPQLVEGKTELDDVTNACSNYADEQNFTKDEKKAITRLCKLSIMGIHNETSEPLEEFLVNNNSTNDEFSKVINRSLSTYTEKDFSVVKDALKKLEGDEENVVFGTVYDVFMSIKNIFN